MNDNSSANWAQNGMPSDDQMDSLLRDFFRLEVPTQLSHPLQLNPIPAATIATLTVAPESRLEHSRTRSVRFIAVTTSVAAMALALLVVISGNDSPPANGSNVANAIIEAPAATPHVDEPMLVSPEGDSQAPTTAVGPDGITLEETDSIELPPQD